VIWKQIRSPPATLTNILTIGVYKEHAFVIKDIAKLAKIYECKDCHHRFTKCCNLQRHSQTCSQGKTVIVCPGEKVEKPQTAYEKVFYPKHYASKASLLWLESEAKKRKKHIHHAMCGHGGERWIEGAPVDGYHYKTIPRLSLAWVQKMFPARTSQNNRQRRQNTRREVQSDNRTYGKA